MGFLIFILASATALADCSQPVIQDLKKVSHLPPTRYQENSQLCFAMSGMQLINRLNCVQTGHCSFGFTLEPGPDEFSVRDALSAYYKGSDAKAFGQGGDPQLFFKKVSRLGKLAPEICAPYAQLEALSLSNPGVDLNNFLKKVYEDYVSSKMTAPCFVDSHLHDLQQQGLYLKNFIVDVQEALASKELSEFLQKVMLPPRCEIQRKSLPSFKIQKFESDEESNLGKKIDDLIGNDIPITFSHNIYTRLPSTNPDQILGGHAANIIGKRDACCGEKCERQYLVADSSGITPTERWEPQSTILKSIKELNDVYRFAQNFQSSTPQPMKTPALLERILERARIKTGRIVRVGELNFKTDTLIGDEPELIWIEPAKN